VEQLRSETHFRAWLEAQRRLRRYSPRNVLWILFQRPGATHVASYKTWKEGLGYQVRGGEVSIKVWAPGHRRKVDQEAEDAEEVDGRPPFFVLGSVFDRSQVDPIPGEAKPLEPPPPGPVDGDSHAWAIEGLESFAATLGYQVRRLSLPEGNDGFCDYGGRVIGVSESLPPNRQVRALAHEGAHASGIESKTFGRGRAEVIVDCATHIVCARIGLDVSAASVPYVAAWAGEDGGVIARDAGEIDRIARTILRGAGLGEIRGG
jgi:antirestriction protein ArdC